jgi:hypothetical protein
MPLLRDIVQPEKVEEGTALSASGPAPSADAGARYRFETKDKKGAESLMERLQASERSISTWPSSTPRLSKRGPMEDPLSPHRRDVDASMRLPISQDHRMLGSRLPTRVASKDLATNNFPFQVPSGTAR